ncbi:MAG: hypothetical protein LBG04_02405 [Holosporaceae bacterium]|nr:hypothetical protein [Holosporaceae bacterium]
MGIDDFGRLILRMHDRDLFISSGDMFLGEKVVSYE